MDISVEIGFMGLGCQFCDLYGVAVFGFMGLGWLCLMVWPWVSSISCSSICSWVVGDCASMGPIGSWVDLASWVVGRGSRWLCVDGLICLISIKLCCVFGCGWLWEVEEEGWWWLDCRFLSLSLSLVGGHGLRSGRETLLVAGFFFFFFSCCGLWLWLVGQWWRWPLLLCWFLWWMYIIILLSCLYYFKWLLKK